MKGAHFQKLVSDIFKSVAVSGRYSMEIAGLIGYGTAIKAVDMPEEMSKAVDKYGGGCCFHFAWKLVYELNKAGIEARWAVVPEPMPGEENAQKCVVAYKNLYGKMFIADIVEEVKDAVTLEDYQDEYSCKRVDSTGCTIDRSMLTIEQAILESDSPQAKGYLWIYKKPKDNNLEFWDFMRQAEPIKFQ